MGLANPRTGDVWARLASGIEAGIVGGLAMLGIMVSESLWEGHVWWEMPGLLGSTFYGPRAFRSDANMATLSGLALHFVITGTLGGLFGLAFGGIQQRGRLVLLGLLASVGWYNLANVSFWPKVNPWVLLASPRPATVVSHVLLGACLGYMGQRQKFGSPAPAATRTFFPTVGLAATIDIPAPSDLAGPAGVAPWGETCAETCAETSPMYHQAEAVDGTLPAGGQQPPVVEQPPPAAASSDALE